MTTATTAPTDARTDRTRRAYDRASRWYDIQEWLPEKLAFRKWRRRLWEMVPDGQVLEIGVGTGKNLRYYRESHKVTAIDLSPKMLDHARRNAERWGVPVDLRLMDAQALEIEASSFDSVVSTFVFCSVPDPVLGLREALRVLKPDGRAYLLEHVLSGKQPMRWMMQRLNGVVSTLGGANINRETVANVEAAGFTIVEVQDLWGDVVKLIVAEKPAVA